MKYSKNIESNDRNLFIAFDFSKKGYNAMRHEPRKEQITGEALIVLKDLIRELEL